MPDNEAGDRLGAVDAYSAGRAADSGRSIGAQHSASKGKRARFSLVQDVTERQQLHHQLVHQAHHDMLTGLPNRLLLLDRMEQALASAARRGKKAAVICLDLDRFKQINDTYGHAIGDLCLKQVAERLKSRSARRRHRRALGRRGIHGRCGRSGVGGGCDADCGGSAGVAAQAAGRGSVPDRPDAPALGSPCIRTTARMRPELWRNADAAMYRVKRSGGNDFVLVSQEISQSTTEANEAGTLHAAGAERRRS